MKSYRSLAAFGVFCLLVWTVLYNFSVDGEKSLFLVHAGQVVAAGIWVVLVLLASYGAGSLVVRRRKSVQAEQDLESVFLNGVLGLGLLIVVFVLLLAVGIFNLWTVCVLVILLAAYGMRQVWPKRPPTWTLEGESAIPKALTCFLAGLYIVLCLTPVRDYDALIYHLVAAQAWVGAGRFVEIPNNVYTHFPMNIQVLYASTLATVGATGVKLMNAALGCLAVWGTYSIGRRLGGVTAGWMAALLFLGVSVVGELMTSALIDLGLTVFATAAILAVLRWRDEPSTPDALLAAFFCGMAFSCKYTAVLTVLAPCVLLMVLPSERTSVKDRIRIVGLTGALVLLLFLPWGIKTFLWKGNPFFPLFYDILGGHGWTSEKAAIFANAHRSLIWSSSEPLKAVSVWLLGWIESRPVIPGTLLLAAVLFPWKKPPKPGRSLWAAFLVGLTLWFVCSQGEDRFLTPLLPMLAVLASLGVAQIPASLQWRLVLFLFVLMSLLGNWYAMLEYAYVYPAAIRQVFRGEYYADKRFYPEQDAIQKINDIYLVDPSMKILFVGEARAFGCRAPFVAPTVFDEHPLLLAAASSDSAVDIARNLRSQGFTHILYNANELFRFQRDYAAYGVKDESELGRLSAEVLRCCGRVTFEVEVPSGYGRVVLFEIGESR